MRDIVNISFTYLLIDAAVFVTQVLGASFLNLGLISTRGPIAPEKVKQFYCVRLLHRKSSGPVIPMFLV